MACVLVVIGSVARSPVDSLIGFAILGTGLGVYLFFSRNAASPPTDN